MNKAITDFEKFEQDGITLYCGDNREILPLLDKESIEACVTDPPYELGFMGKAWDSSGIAYDSKMWKSLQDVLKPGGYCLAFGGSRTYHRMACAIEDSGFEIRDQIMWVYGQGFPKSLDISKAIDKRAGAQRKVVGQRNLLGKAKTLKGGNYNSPASGKTETPIFHITEPATDLAKTWSGWGTALKPAHEPVAVARKPFDGTVAENVNEHGCGGINIDACRVGLNPGYKYRADANGTTFHGNQGDRIKQTAEKKGSEFIESTKGRYPSNLIHDGSAEVLSEFPRKTTNLRYNPPAGNKPGGNSLNMSKVGMPEGATGTWVAGRWPANLIHDGSEEVIKEFPEAGNGWKKNYGEESYKGRQYDGGSFGGGGYLGGSTYADSGSAARFFYCAKTSSKERGEDNKHATVKPIALMRYLCKLVTRPGGTVIDPFMGSGSTGLACILEGFKFIGIEKDKESFETAKKRIQEALSNRVQTLEDYFVD